MDEQILEEKIIAWCDALSEKSKLDTLSNGMNIDLAYTYGYDWNAKYIRIWYTSANTRSSFAFVDHEGNIYKCAGWKAPAKGIRGHIDNPPMSLGELYRRG